MTRARLTASSRPVLSSKAAPYVWPGWVNDEPQWQLVRYADYALDGFAGNSVVYAAIMYKVRALTSAPLRAYTGDPDTPEPLKPAHPLSQLVARPNKHQSWMEFQQQCIVYLNLSGNVYVYQDRGKEREGLPAALYSLRPDRVRIIPGSGEIAGYLYVPEGKAEKDGVPILPRNIIHVKLPNPFDPLEGMGYGLSPIAPLARSGDVDNMVTKFLWNFFKRGAQGMAALSFDIALGDTEIAKLRSQWQETYGGYERWDKPLVLGSGGKYENLTPQFDKLGFNIIDARNTSRILGPLGVPGMLIGYEMSSATFSNFEQAERVFWQNTMIPELRLFEVDYGYSLQTEDGGFVKFDLSDVPALQNDLVPIVNAAHQLWQMGVPRDQALKIMSIETEPTPGGMESFIPMGMTPYGSTPAAAIAEPAPEPDTTNIGAAEQEDEADDDVKKKPYSSGLRLIKTGSPKPLTTSPLPTKINSSAKLVPILRATNGNSSPSSPKSKPEP